MTPAERWPCEHWCRAVSIDLPGDCDCGMADIRAIAADRDHLRTILGLQPGERLCGATALDPWAISGPAATCLLPASHIDDGHWHRSLGGSWSL